MIYLKTNPVGVDVPIQKIQKSLNDLIKHENKEVYGRVYINRKKDDLLLEHYFGKNEYKDVLTNDDTLIFFFIINDEAKLSEVFNSVDVRIVCISNLSKLYPLITHRADEELRQDIYNILQKHKNYLDLSNWHTGINKVLPEIKPEKLLGDDDHPYHILGFKGKLKFNYHKKPC